MSTIELVYLIAIVAAGLLFIFHKYFDNVFASPIFSPPHEFAYGAALTNIEELPVQVDRFLSLDGMDPEKIKIQTYLGNSSSTSLGLLIKAVASRKRNALNPLIASIKEVNDLPNKKEQAIKLIEALIPYRDHLRNEAKKDDLIIFIHYGLKQPADLPLGVRGQMESYVTELDTPSQVKRFKKDKCPKNYLLGNINIYPFFLENTFWHETSDMGMATDAPILEIRFMGLKGVFKYLLGMMSKSTGSQFKQLDGEFLE